MFNWIKRLFGYGEEQKAREVVTPTKAQYTTGYYDSHPYGKATTKHVHHVQEEERKRRYQDDDSGLGGFATGLAIGSLLNNDSSPSYDPASASSPSFDGFSGGESGGGGASASWDSAPSCDTGSSSFDSGSSCGSDFSGGGSSDFGS